MGGIDVIWDSFGDKLPDPVFLAYTSFTADKDCHITGGRITVNACMYTWHRGGYGGVGPITNGRYEANLDSVLLHEMGHALGLDHSNKNPAAIVGSVSHGNYPTMHACILDGAQTLHIDDETGIRSLYNAGSFPQAILPIAASPLTCPRNTAVSFANLGGAEDTEWDFGDGSSASGPNVQHKYTAFGAYIVTATSNGLEAQVTVEVKKNVKSPTVKKPKRLRHKPVGMLNGTAS